MLHSLYLFKNVKITPDYSVVHDLTPEDWRTYLIGDSETAGQGDLVWQGDVNYYRLPDVIRIEGNYDDLRKATYGMISGNEEADPEEMVVHSSMQRPMFFWVTDVRLVKQGCRVDLESQSRPWQKDYFDVVELSISVDVWSSNNGSFDLYDSYVERRHMDRWKNEGTAQNPDWKPIYYPNAAQGIEGAYKVENIEKIVKGHEFAGSKLDAIRYHADPTKTYDVGLEIGIMTYLSKEGDLKILGFAGCLVAPTDSDKDYSENCNVFYGDGDFKWVVDPMSAISESFLTAVKLTAEYIQSFNVFKAPPALQERLRLTNTSDTQQGLVICPSFGYMKRVTFDDADWIYFDLIGGIDYVGELMVPASCTINPITPDRSHVDEEDVDSSQYYDEHEPMMYYNPARDRKVIASLGGELFDVPDIVAFENHLFMMNMIEIASMNQSVGVKENPSESNALGAYGLVTPPTLPIFNSAWRSYDAISKVSDTIMYNAKQMQTIGSGATSTALGGVGGFTQGGPAGAIAGIISGIVGTGLSYYGNDEELRAKRMQIKNSPCVVKSTGTGFTNAYLGLIDCYYATLKMDDQSLEKLRFMYYWYGYHVNRTFKGSIDLHTRTKFDFIKTSGAKVKGDLTAGAAKEIGSIFDRGVTIYHGPEGYALIGSGNMVANDEVDNT